MNLSSEFKNKVREAMLRHRENYGGTDSDYAKTMGIKPAILSRLKKGETERLLSDTIWITIGRELDVRIHDSSWNVARTSVYTQIEDSLQFCKEYIKSMILVDDCGIGKTFCARHIIRSMKNAFYLDCSQCKTKQQFIRQLARNIGVDNKGRYVDVKANLKYYINLLEKPVIVLDEAGDLDYNAFLELKELWNGTDGSCGWYMIGADGLRNKIKRGIENKKVGYAEIFSRFSDEYITLVPASLEDKKQFYSNLIGTVASANITDKGKTKELVRKCLHKEATLRYLETLIKIGA
jgi:hypothetical protein